MRTGEGQKAALISVNLTGGDRRVHLTSENATEFVPSPDEKFVAWVERFNAYVAPLPLTGKPIDVSTSVSDFPAKRISRDAGKYLHWAPDSRRVYWALGPELYKRDVSATFAFETMDTTTLAKDPESKGVPIGFKAAADQPTGTSGSDGRDGDHDERGRGDSERDDSRRPQPHHLRRLRRQRADSR